jgi:hydroxymethylpyrimidine pyrophosphatase-like HAD family hydrolase
MGRPYAGELSTLDETYSWAMEAPIDSLVVGLSASACLPLVGVGSGGSLSAAHLACFLHQSHTGQIARPVTPLEILSSALNLGCGAAMILSAGGSNKDIIAALLGTAQREPRRCIVVCLQEGTRLAKLARSYRYVDLLELRSPWGKDGFLATNSLLAFAVLLVRAYERAFSTSDTLPQTLSGLFRGAADRGPLRELGAACQSLWERETLVVLHGPTVSSAAIDLESKFSEAALGNIQIADFRNFAHGRHHWIAKHGPRTGVLAIFADDERELAEKTVGLLPRSVPLVRMHLPYTGSKAAVAALVSVLHLVGLAGKQRGIDPGRPGVPEFGRRIYALGMPGAPSRQRSTRTVIPIARKLRRDVRSLPAHPNIRAWQTAYDRFLDDIAQAVFGGIVFDYDGTLCDERDRFSGIRDDISRHLARLLSAGIPVGVATGRGRSVREDLRKVVPKRLWKGVHIAYYNGAAVALLTDELPVSATTPLHDSVRRIADAVSNDPVLATVATWEIRFAQISIQPKSPSGEDLAWRAASQLAHANEMVVVRSGHSIDILAPHVSKRALLPRLRAKVRAGTQILLIGDKGQWPGNDATLLSDPFSLSVDEVSADPTTCWNLAPPGYRGVQATLAYLAALRESKGKFRVSLPSGRLSRPRTKQA